MTSDENTGFHRWPLRKQLLKALDEVGYETATPIQEETIPILLEGRDMLGQAQTGTGKTAAFALPLLTNLDLEQKDPQVLVLAPTRELAIQVAEAFQKYAAYIKGFHVLPIYGGQEYGGQIRGLKRGVHVVVGTPGRVMDHMRKGTLKLGGLKTLVLDEADEMLRMGFIEDVEWVLEQIPDERQICLFSATLPKEVRRIANRFLRDPAEITIKVKTANPDTIHQRYWPVKGVHKLDALTRILEAETFDAMLIFVRTKIATSSLAEKLEARGYACSVLNGDVSQNKREQTIKRLKGGKIDILIATDVAARGLDVDRISHVVNYDIPHDTEAYIHRIGRTGRAGRKGDAILFVSPRERRMLGAIEKATRQKIEMMELPSTELLNDQRIVKFQQRITDTLSSTNLDMFKQMLDQYRQEHDVPALDIAAALAHLIQGDIPLLLKNKPEQDRRKKDGPDWKPETDRDASSSNSDRERGPRKKEVPLEEGMQRYRVEVGHIHNVAPGNIVGAIANEAGLDSKYIGRIDIRDDYSLVDLPEGMPKDIFQLLKEVWVAGQTLKISPADKNSEDYKPRKRHKPDRKSSRKGDFNPKKRKHKKDKS